MSFILEALRKSENERQRQSGPDLASIPEATGQRAASRWPLLVAVLILFNVVLLAVVFWPEPDEAQRVSDEPASTRQDTTGPAAELAGRPPEEARAPDQAASRPVTSTTPPEASSGAPGPQPETQPDPASGPAPAGPGGAQSATGDATAKPSPRQVRSLSEEAMAPDDSHPQPLRQEQQATAAGDVVGAPTTTGVTTPGSGSAPEQGTARSNEAAPAPSPPPRDEGLPTANELRLQGFLTGPPLHLDLHVYYPEASRRVVFISGNRYREGDRVKDGPVVREIVPEGVVLEERGRRFLLGPD